MHIYVVLITEALCFSIYAFFEALTLMYRIYENENSNP